MKRPKELQESARKSFRRRRQDDYGNGGNGQDTEGGVQGGCSYSLAQEKTMAGKMIVATGNRNKMIEIREILSDVDVEIVSMKEAGIRVEIVENGRSFAENSAIKALTVAKASGEMAIADDSGLVIDCLRGEPGIWSARYMGEDTPYELKNRTLISRVNDFCRGYEAAGGALAAMEGAEFLENRKWKAGPAQIGEVCLRMYLRVAGWNGENHRRTDGRADCVRPGRLARFWL